MWAVWYIQTFFCLQHNALHVVRSLPRAQNDVPGGKALGGRTGKRQSQPVPTGLGSLLSGGAPVLPVCGSRHLPVSTHTHQHSCSWMVLCGRSESMCALSVMKQVVEHHYTASLLKSVLVLLIWFFPSGSSFTSTVRWWTVKGRSSTYYRSR